MLFSIINFSKKYFWFLFLYYKYFNFICLTLYSFNYYIISYVIHIGFLSHWSFLILFFILFEFGYIGGFDCKKECKRRWWKKESVYNMIMFMLQFISTIYYILKLINFFCSCYCYYYYLYLLANLTWMEW